MTRQGSSYSNSVFLQSLLSKRMLSMTEAYELYLNITNNTNEDITLDSFKRIITGINKNLDEIDLEIKQLAKPDSGDLYLGLVNSNGDEIAQLATNFNPNQLQCFKKLVDLIMKKPKFSLSSMSAIGEGSEFKLSKKDTEEFIDSLVKDYWLSLESGQITLGMRSLMELNGYLASEYDEHVRYCNLCEGLALNFVSSCTNNRCSVILHQHCANRFYTNKNGNAKCTDCDQEWDLVQ